MSKAPGCFKFTLLGCLGFFAIIVLIVGITAVVAWVNLDDKQIEDRVLTPVADVATVAADADSPVPVSVHHGRLILDLAQGEFQIHPAEAGEKLTIRAEYDAEVHRLEEEFESLPDSSWVYRLRFYQTMPLLQSLFRQLMGGGYESSIHVYIPPDIPIELELAVEKGGFEAELGGLWITAAAISYRQGGFSLSFDEPLQKPMESLSIHGRMGGFEAFRLGNASPRSLDIECAMGGADVDLKGRWLRSCDARLSVTMGGMDVRTPRDIEVVTTDDDEPIRRADAETPLPVLRLKVSEKMGGIEIQ